LRGGSSASTSSSVRSLSLSLADDAGGSNGVLGAAHGSSAWEGEEGEVAERWLSHLRACLSRLRIRLMSRAALREARSALRTAWAASLAGAANEELGIA